jgi:hypothetical protein
MSPRRVEWNPLQVFPGRLSQATLDHRACNQGSTGADPPVIEAAPGLASSVESSDGVTVTGGRARTMTSTGSRNLTSELEGLAGLSRGQLQELWRRLEGARTSISRRRSPRRASSRPSSLLSCLRQERSHCRSSRCLPMPHHLREEAPIALPLLVYRRVRPPPTSRTPGRCSTS